VKTSWKQGNLSRKYSKIAKSGGDGGDDFYRIQKINPD
jgi:hypothetical protein